jgi:hypothetical protein
VHCFKNKRIEQNIASFSKPLLFTIALGANIYSVIDFYEDVAILLLILGPFMKNCLPFSTPKIFIF